ncbi:hypothetical protein [Sediminibacterium soli]|uniref:hypothetical protein n=1 Tax=Sediminibacterium soli TaxID=2698829 RepID=UPI001379C4DA|nr:hypothetical protein [Sediminibacterium soli]NCI46850.1 hypothetical protein [Sediminibacterium soli]
MRVISCLLGSLIALSSIAQSIDRQKLVRRHIVHNKTYDSLSSLSVGNGRFAFTADITGMQTYPEAYAGGVPLGTQSQWGWHSFRDTTGYRFSETLQYYALNGRQVPYSVQVKEPARNRNAVEWFRQNPHRLQLGAIGLEIKKKDGTAAQLTDIHDIDQQLDPWTGEIHSRFSVEDVPVDVTTYCHQEQDIISFRISSSLMQQGRLRLRIRFPYPNGEFKDAGTGWLETGHRTELQTSSFGAVIKHSLDSTDYYVQLRSGEMAELVKKKANEFSLLPKTGDMFSISFRFAQKNDRSPLPGFEETAADSRQRWQDFWVSGGAVDLSGTTDPRAVELERRIVLSQYLTKIQCAGDYPPQETGLTYNSWFGKPHLEMHWWHGIHFALWGRPQLLERSMSWYEKVSAEAKNISERQGYKGVRWQKMTDHAGKESPSSIGAFLIWQQPHFIYFAELLYRENKDLATIRKYSKLVFASADFMASFAYYDKQKKKYVLGKGVIPAQERFKALDTYNPAYELAYWHWALSVAQQWRQRLKMPADPAWARVITELSPLAIQDGKYLFTESATDSYTNPEYRTDHPSVLGALGMLPQTPLVNKVYMRRTFDWIWQNWNWHKTWGWDFPMTAMTAARLGMPDKAIDALLMPVQTNTYLNNGHNYQDQRLTLYLPGNGGLLAAVAMMCAGFDGSGGDHPGFPKNWVVRYEGLRKMP